MNRIVGVSHSPTPNKIMINGEPVHLRCGADIFLTGLFQDLEGETKCASCEGTISIELKSRKITKLSPSTSIIHFVVIPGADPASFGIQCGKTFVFD